MRNKTKYLPSEATTSFCFSELCAKIKKEIKQKYPKIADQQIKEIFPQVTEEQLKNRKILKSIPDHIMRVLMLKNLEKFNINGQTFEYLNQKNHLGGYRWYVLCPKCKRPNLKLYLPDKFNEKEQKYLCKECHGLKNTSSLIGATNKYKKVLRPLKKLEALKLQLLNKRLSPEKAKPLLLEYEQIERELVASPEYRLWKFQKGHSVTVEK